MATQRKMPAALAVKLPDVAVLPMSPLEEVKTGVPLQVVSVGGKSWNVIEPVGLKPPLKVAVSWIVVPTGPPAEGVVPIVGVALVMVTGVQAVLADGLLTSPPEVAVLPLSGLVEVNTGVPEQVSSPGGKSVKVTLPVGLTPPLTVAVSWIMVPTGPPGDGVCEIVAGCRWLMNVHASGAAAWPVNVAVVPFREVGTSTPAIVHCTLTRLWLEFGTSVTVSVGVIPAVITTSADAKPLMPPIAPVVAVGSIMPLEMVFWNVRLLASAGVGLMRAPVASWISLVITSSLLHGPVTSLLRMSPKVALLARKKSVFDVGPVTALRFRSSPRPASSPIPMPTILAPPLLIVLAENIAWSRSIKSVPFPESESLDALGTPSVRKTTRSKGPWLMT